MTQAQKNYIAVLTKRLFKVIKKGHKSYDHLMYGLNADFTTKEASEWIQHLKDMIFAHNSVIAYYAVDGGRSRKGQI